jgi:hypothetical protein
VGEEKRDISEKNEGEGIRGMRMGRRRTYTG